MNKSKILLIICLLFSTLSFSKLIEFNGEKNGTKLENIIINKNFSIIEFYKPTCKPCLKYDKTLEFVSNELNLDITKINLQAYNNLSKLYNISAYPTIIIFENGKIAKRIVGTRTSEHLIYDITEVIKTIGKGVEKD